MILSFLAHLYSTEFNFRRRTIPPHEKCYKSFRKEQVEKKEERDLEQSFENAGMKREGRSPWKAKLGHRGFSRQGNLGLFEAEWRGNRQRGGDVLVPLHCPRSRDDFRASPGKGLSPRFREGPRLPQVESAVVGKHHSFVHSLHNYPLITCCDAGG